MLVLSRKVGETLRIGDDVTIVVRRVAGSKVTIGIEAPAETKVLRGELQPKPPTDLDDASPHAGPTCQDRAA